MLSWQTLGVKTLLLLVFASFVTPSFSIFLVSFFSSVFAAVSAVGAPAVAIAPTNPTGVLWLLCCCSASLHYFTFFFPLFFFLVCVLCISVSCLLLSFVPTMKIHIPCIIQYSRSSEGRPRMRSNLTNNNKRTTTKRRIQQEVEKETEVKKDIKLVRKQNRGRDNKNEITKGEKIEKQKKVM